MTIHYTRHPDNQSVKPLSRSKSLISYFMSWWVLTSSQISSRLCRSHQEIFAGIMQITSETHRQREVSNKSLKHPLQFKLRLQTPRRHQDHLPRDQSLLMTDFFWRKLVNYEPGINEGGSPLVGAKRASQGATRTSELKLTNCRVMGSVWDLIIIPVLNHSSASSWRGLNQHSKWWSLYRKKNASSSCVQKYSSKHSPAGLWNWKELMLASERGEFESSSQMIDEGDGVVYLNRSILCLLTKPTNGL